jgi:hypothetical protein
MMSEEYNEEEVIERRMSDRREISYLRSELTALAAESRVIAAKVNSMGGVLKVAIGCMIAGITIGLWIITDTRAHVSSVDDECRGKYDSLSTKVLEMNLTQIQQDNNLLNVLNVISINQKRVMVKLTLPYMQPERIRSAHQVD